MKATQNKQIAGRINVLKTTISNYSQHAHGMGAPNAPEALRALEVCKQIIEEVRTLVMKDPVFSKDLPLIDLPNYYSDLLRHAQSSSTVAEEVVQILAEDENIFSQDHEDGMTYRRLLKELADRRM